MTRNTHALYYTGIGSRKTPDRYCAAFTLLAARLEHQGYILRSGGAIGADTAFENGVTDPDNTDIYLPWKDFNNNTSDKHEVCDKAMEIAAHYHPAWDRCNRVARLFHGRNSYQVLGDDLNTPSEFVFCWSPNSGGTEQALRIARDYGIPIFNMHDHRVADAFLLKGSY